jgi:hypothetical protein
MITSDNKKYNASLPCKKLSLGISWCKIFKNNIEIDVVQNILLNILLFWVADKCFVGNI